jgi:hypothetical protein
MAGGLYSGLLFVKPAVLPPASQEEDRMDIDYGKIL